MAEEKTEPETCEVTAQATQADKEQTVATHSPLEDPRNHKAEQSLTANTDIAHSSTEAPVVGQQVTPWLRKLAAHVECRVGSQLSAEVPGKQQKMV